MQKGWEHLWIIGDRFCHHTLQHYYRHIKDEDGKSPYYCYNTFEVTEFFSSRYKTNNASTLGRIINNLVFTLNKHGQLPRCIVVVPDDDIIKHFKDSPFLKAQVDTITQWLTNKFTRAIKAYKEFLPFKCKRSAFPQVIWICPPTHRYFGKASNSKRETFAASLERHARITNGMTAL